MTQKNKPLYFIRKCNESGKLSRNKFNGYEGHYLLILPLKIKTRKERESFEGTLYNKANICEVMFMGSRYRIFTDGYTHKIRPLIPLIKKRVMDKVIANPRKYLDEVK